MENLSTQIKNAVKNWWLLLLVGVLFIISGIWTFTNSEESLLGLGIFFSVLYFTGGLFQTLFALSNSKVIYNWGWMFAFGLLNTIIGVYLMTNPEISVLVLSILIGFTTLFNAIWGIAFAIDIKNYGDSQWLPLLIMAILVLLFALLMIFNPAFAGFTLAVWIGIALITFGLFNVLLSFRVRNVHKNWDKLSEEFKKRYDDLNNSITVEIRR